MSVEKLLSDHGLDGEQTLAWAKERADALVGQLEDPQLRALLEGGEVDLAPARADQVDVQASPASLPPTPSRSHASQEPATESAAEAGESQDELEELDMDELEMVEDEADAADTNEPSSPEYRPTDTQPLAAVDAEIVEEDEFDPSADFDPAAEAEPSVEPAPVRTGDTDTSMDRQAVMDAAPEQVEDQGSGDLFDEDELDIDIDI